jgi:hypothetical protein
MFREIEYSAKGEVLRFIFDQNVSIEHGVLKFPRKDRGDA